MLLHVAEILIGERECLDAGVGTRSLAQRAADIQIGSGIADRERLHRATLPRFTWSRLVPLAHHEFH